MSRALQAASGVRVGVIGGGLAGLAAAAAAVQSGLRVELFEARRRLGGRAGSFLDPQTGLLVDFGQHVALGCCTNWADFCRRTQLTDAFERHGCFHWIGPDGRTSPFAPSWLPAPFHGLSAILGLKYLSWPERLGVLRAAMALARHPPRRPGGLAPGPPGRGPIPPAENLDTHEPTMADWLEQQRQSRHAVEGFWALLLISALSESLDRTSVDAARKVFRDGLLAHRRAFEMHVPREPLGQICDRRVGTWLQEHGVVVHRAARVQRIDGDGHHATALVLGDGTRRPFDFFILAVPWRSVAGLLAPAIQQPMPPVARLAHLPGAPITTVHLWLDRPIMGFSHAVMVGRLGQWVFAGPARETDEPGAARPSVPDRAPGCPNHEAFRGSRPAGQPASAPSPPSPPCAQPLRDSLARMIAAAGVHYRVVISASHRLRGMSRQEILAQVRRELEEIWPLAREAELLHWRVVTQRDAVFSMCPGIERLRPAQRTAVANLMLAGDWTDTGWPATMEGAVRSGYLAVEAILATIGRPRPILVPDLPKNALVRWLLGG